MPEHVSPTPATGTFPASLAAPMARWRTGEIGLSVVLALQMAVMFAVGPLAATGYLPPVLVDMFRVGLAGAAVLLVARGRVLPVLVLGAFVLSAALSLGLRSHAPDIVLNLARLAAAAAFDGALAAVVAQMVFAPGRVTVHRIMGAVILYLSIGLIFANAYMAAALTLHPSFSSLATRSGGLLGQMIYFSLSTLTTTGFGDIAPVHAFVRSLANLEGVIGQLFPATLLARLVTLHAAGAGSAGGALSAPPPPPPPS